MASLPGTRYNGSCVHRNERSLKADLCELAWNAIVRQTEVTPLRILLCSSGIYVIGGHRDRHFLHFFLLAEQFFCSTLKRRARSEDAHGKTRGACPLDGRLCCSDAFTDESDSHTGCCSLFPFVNFRDRRWRLIPRSPMYLSFYSIKLSIFEWQFERHFYTRRCKIVIQITCYVRS